MEKKENKRLKFSEFNFSLIKKSEKESDFIYKLKRILDIFKNYDPNSKEFWSSIKTIVDNDDDWMSELGKIYGQGKDYAIEIYEELLEEFSNEILASSTLLKKIAQNDINQEIPDQTDLGNVNTQQINQDKGGFPDTSEVESSGISSGASLKAIQLIGQTSLSGIMQGINWIGISSDQGHLGVYETELQGKGFRLNLNRIQSEISELTQSMQIEVNSFMQNYLQNINDQFSNNKEIMRFNINYGGQNWTFGPEDIDVFMARNKEEIEVLVIGEVMVHEATHANGDMGEDGPVKSEKIFLSEAITFLNNKRKVDGVLPLLLGVKGESMANSDIFIEKSAGNWYTKKDNVKTSGAEDILSGMIEHASEGYPDDESQLTPEQIEELRKIGYSNYTNIRTKTELFLKFPNSLYYSSYDLTRYIESYGHNRSDLKILWDRVKSFGHIYSFPKIKDNFPSYILSDYMENPSIIDEKYIFESIGYVFTEKDEYSERLYDVLKEKYPDIYVVSTNISEEEENDLIDNTMQVPSIENLEKLKILSRKDMNDESNNSSKKIFNKLLKHSDFFPTIERAARGGHSKLSGQSAGDILDFFTEILNKAEKGETYSYSEEGTPIVVVSQNIDDEIKNFFMIGETRVSRSVIENTIKTLEKINTKDNDRYISYDIDFMEDKENLGRYQKEVYENKIRKLYQDNEDYGDYGEGSQSYEELLESQKHLMPNIDKDTIYLTSSEGDFFPIGKTSENSAFRTLEHYKNYQDSIFYSTSISPVIKTSLFREWFYNKLEEHPNKNHFFLTLADNYVFMEMMSAASSHVYQTLVNNYNVVKEKDYDYNNGLPYYKTLDTEYLLINEILNLIPNEIKDNNFFEISGWLRFTSKFFSKEKVIKKMFNYSSTDLMKVIDHIDCREGFDEETKLKLKEDIVDLKNKEKTNMNRVIPDIIRNNGKKINILDFKDLSEYIDVTLNRLLPNDDRAFYNSEKGDYVSSLESAKEEISETEVWLVDSLGFMKEIGDGIKDFESGPNRAKGFYAQRYSLMDNPCIVIYTSGGQAKGYESILKDIIGLDNSQYNGMEFGMESTLWHEISHAMMNRITPSSGSSSNSSSSWLTNPSEILAINYGNIVFLRNRLETFFREEIVEDGKIERGLIAQIKSDIIQEFPLEFYGSTREEAEAKCEGILDEIAKDTAQNNLTKEQKIQLVTSVFTAFFTGMDMRSIVESEIEKIMNGSGLTKRYDFKEEIIPPEKEDNWYAMKRDEIVSNLEKREDYKNFIANANKRVHDEVRTNGITNVVRPYVNNRGTFNTPTDIWSLSMLIFSPPWGNDIDIKTKNSFFSDLIPESLFTDVQEIVYRQNQLRSNWSYNDRKENVTPQEAEDAGKFMVDMQEEYGPDFVYLQKNNNSWYKTSQKEMSPNVFSHNKVKNAYIKEMRGGYSVGIGKPGNRVFVFVKSDDIDTNVELDGSLTVEIPRKSYISLMAKRDKKINDIEQEKSLLRNNDEQRLEMIKKVEERREKAPKQPDMFPEETQRALRDEFSSNNNWYKSADKKITIKDLNKISDDDWSRINDMMNADGYDFRGGEDTKEIFFRLTNKSGGMESNFFPDHYNAFVSVYGPLGVSDVKRESNPILQAKRDYGLTDNIYEAGFILPDGSLLNMSGGGSGGRALDHHEMAQYFPETDSQYEGLNNFMMLGAIRCSFGRSSSMDIVKEPTAYQYRVIESAVNGIEEFYLDLSFGDGNKVPFLYGSANPRNNGRVNSKRVINDIKRFYSQSGPVRNSKNINWYKIAQSEIKEDYKYRYPKVNGNINGLEILDEIPNFSSIASSFNDYEILPGIRQIPISDFSRPEYIFYAENDYKRSKTLSSSILNSNKISPLIVAIDDDGPYLLEGAHRYVALCDIGVDFFPALVVIDKDDDKIKESNVKDWYKNAQQKVGKYNMKLDIPIPNFLLNILDKFKKNGYQALIVGGAVRDAILGNQSKDIDIEVYGTNYESLVSMLELYGRVDVVGKAFGVIKFTDSEGNDYDFSVPRRDNKVGKGHKGFNIEFDPSIQPKEAASRRDFTINSLAYDPLTHEIHDYFGGIEDLNNKILRATSPAFAEDSLRVLRGMQFVARFGFNIEPETAKMASTLKDEPLVIERVKEEWMKLFTKGKFPSKIIQYLIDTEWIDKYPELKGIIDVEQDPEWHPCGSVDIHTAHVMDAAAAIADERGIKGEARAVLIASALCHDLGKASTTKIEIKNGVERVTSRGHAEKSVPLTKSFLESIGMHKNIINQVVPLVGSHMKHIDFNEKSKNANVRQIAESLFPATIEQLEMVIRSDMEGRPPLDGGLPDSAQKMVDLAKEENIYKNKSQPLIQGKDVIEFYPSVPRNQLLGDALRYSYKKQLEGSVKNKDQALAVAINYLRQKISFINGNDILSVIGGTGGPHVGEIINNAWESQIRGDFNDKNDAMLWLNSNYGNKIAETTHWYKMSQSYSSDSSDIFETILDFDSLKEIHRLEYILFNLDQREYLNNTPKYYQMKEKLILISNQILKKILAVYTHWVKDHTKSGWFNNHVGGILIGEGEEGNEESGLYYINIKEQVLTKLSEEISKNLDNITGYDKYGNMLRAGIESIILISHVPELLNTQKGIEQGVFFLKDSGIDQNEFEGKTEEQIHNIVKEKIEDDYSYFEYADYLINNGFESKDFNIVTNGEEIKESIEEVMPHDEWWQYFIFETPDSPEVIDEIIEDKSMHLYQGSFFYVFEEVAKTLGYDQWVNTINDQKGVNAIQKTIKRISDTKELIENSLSSNNIKNKMIALTIGLNTAHATGGMSQYLGLNEEELEELSNLDFKPWDKELKRISKVSKKWYK